MLVATRLVIQMEIVRSNIATGVFYPMQLCNMQLVAQILCADGEEILTCMLQ
jgi:hypothetical protein